ncbi:unnamed protein product [Cunninghamella blakesleeana]
MDVKVEFNSCGINADTLDDWLESDLRQSGILPSDNKDENIKCEPYDLSMLINRGDSTNSKSNSNSDNKNNNSNLLLPADITPFLKALAILTSLHQQQTPIINDKSNTTSTTTISPLSTILPSVINPLEVTKKSPTPIAPTPTRSSSTKPIIPNIITKPLISNNYASNLISNSNIKKRPREEVEKEEEKESTTINQNESLLDPITLKRQKNTDAARRSRLRKVLKMESLERRVSELERNNDQLRLQIIISETERDNAKLKEAQQRERVEKLEEQLAEAHRSLLMKDQQPSSEDSNDKNDDNDDHHQKDDDDDDKEDNDLKKIKVENID